MELLQRLVAPALNVTVVVVVVTVVTLQEVLLLLLLMVVGVAQWVMAPAPQPLMLPIPLLWLQTGAPRRPLLALVRVELALLVPPPLGLVVASLLCPLGRAPRGGALCQPQPSYRRPSRTPATCPPCCRQTYVKLHCQQLLVRWKLLTEPGAAATASAKTWPCWHHACIAMHHSPYGLQQGVARAP